MHLLLLHTRALITRMAQNVVCNRHHSVERQLCRSLLLNLDRSRWSQLSMTQELIGTMLDMCREGVSEAVGKLQDAELIRDTTRSRITVLDGPGLEARSCEGHQVVKTEFDRLLPHVAR